jgi:hypothetical protein
MSDISYHTASFHSPAQHATTNKASMQCAYQIALLFAFFPSLMRSGWRRRNSVAPQAGSAALGIHGVDSNTKKWPYRARFRAKRDHVYRQYQAISRAFSSEAARAGENRHFISISSDYLVL